VISPVDVLVICGLSAGVAAVGVLAGRLLLRSGQQPHSIGTTLAVVVGVPVLVMGVGIGLAAALMVVSGHALAVLAVVIVAGALSSGAVGVLLVRRVRRGSDALTDAVRQLGSRAAPAPADPPATRELAALWEQLDETHRELLRARERERAAEAGRRELVAWVSHDLRAPLAAIQAMAEAMEDGVVGDADTVREYHGRIREEVDRLSRLVGELFELSRITARAIAIQRRPVDVAALTGEAVDVNTPLAQSCGVTLTSQPCGRVVADADPRQLSRVLANLVVNAVQNTAPGGTVELSCRAEPDAVVLSVQDGCGGIPATDLPRIFDTGFRGQPARTPGEGGAGIGLAIVRGLVEAHAGTIDVTNVDGGCRFDVRLPARERQRREPVEAAGPSLRLRGG
jgi:signal transduction histidine kinase